MPIDKGTSKPITQLSGLQINYKDEYSCFNPPIVTKAERDALVNTDDPAHRIKEGTMVYNSEAKSVQAYQNGEWVNVGGSDPVPNVVTSQDMGVQENLVAYAGNDRTVKDSGLKTSEVRKLGTKKNDVNTTPLYQLSNLGALQFGSNDNVADTGVILVDGLTPVTFQTQGTGADSRVCTVINGELGEGSSSPSALLEINSTEGGFLNARLTTAQRDSLLDPKDGLVIYNNDTKNLNLRQNNVWVEIGSGASSTILPTRLLSNFFYDATLSDCVIITQGGSSYSITLPQITDDIVGKLFVIIDGVGIANTNNITVQGKISGIGSYVIKERFGYVALVAGRPSQGWSIISSSSNSASGNVIGPSASVNNNIAVFDGTSGTIIKDSGFSSSFFRNNNFKNILTLTTGTKGEPFPVPGIDSCKVTLVGSGGSGGKCIGGYKGCGGGAGAALVIYLKNLLSIPDFWIYWSMGFLSEDGSPGVDAIFEIRANAYTTQVRFTAKNGITGSDGSASAYIGGAGGTYQVEQLGSIYMADNYTTIGFNGATGGGATNSGVSGAGANSILGGAGPSVAGNNSGVSSVRNSGSGGSGASGEGLSGGKGDAGIAIIEW